MKLHMITLLLFALVIAGCGDVEWFPEYKSTATRTETTELGGFVSSAENQDGTFTTTVARGIFITFTALQVPAGTPVTLEQHFDLQTQLLTGQLLSAAGQEVLIKEIVTVIQ